MAQRVAAAALALVVCLGVAGCGSKVSKANYERIKDGMTVAEVEGILGKGTEQASSSVTVPGVSAGGVTVAGMSASGKSMVWQDGGKVITVMFGNDKVMAKSQAGL